MQFTPVLRLLPAFLLIVAAAAVPAAPVLAQTRHRVKTDGEWFHQEANDRRLARLARGAVVTSAETQGDWMRVTIEGWIWGESVGPTPRAGFDLAVTRAPEENLRSSAGGALVAKLQQGFLLTKVADDGPWVRVQRSGWVLRSSVETAPVAESGGGTTTPGQRPGVGTPDTAVSAPADPARMQPLRQTLIYRAPDGPEAGSLSPETPVRVLGKTGEWTRVQVEAWVKTTDLEVAPPGVLVGVSAAELRAEPQRYEGQVLRWTLQFIAADTADELRPDMPSGATYLLAKGPLPERAFVYVVVPDSLRRAAARLAPLTMIDVTARVRRGRSRHLGHPVVDLLALEARR